MKIIIIIAALLFSIGNSFSKGNDKLYKNIIEDKEKQTVTTTICKGQNDMNLVPLMRHVLKRNLSGKLLERISYKWDSYRKGWIAVQKYIYMNIIIMKA